MNSQKVPFAIVSHQAKTTACDFGKSSQVQPGVRSGHWKLAPQDLRCFAMIPWMAVMSQEIKILQVASGFFVLPFPCFFLLSFS